MLVDIACSSREVFGSDRSALRLARVVAGLGHDARLLVPEHRPERGLAAMAQAADVRVLPDPLGIASSNGVELSPRWALRRRSTPRADVTVLNTSAVLDGPIAARHHVVVVREWLDPGRRTHRLLATLQAARARAIVGISTGVLSQWSAATRIRRPTTLVWNWLDEDQLERLAGAPRSDPREGIVCVGRFNQWKGQSTLADAWEDLRDQTGAQPPLAFVGAELDRPDTIGDLSRALHNRGADRPWRVIPVDDAPEAYVSGAALLVLPSLQPEPFGNVLLEGLALGCRVLAFEGGGPDDLAPRFPGTLEVIPRSRAALTAALVRWCDEGRPAQSERQRAATWATLRADFSAARAERDWDPILQAAR